MLGGELVSEAEVVQNAEELIQNVGTAIWKIIPFCLDYTGVRSGVFVYNIYGWFWGAETEQGEGCAFVQPSPQAAVRVLATAEVVASARTVAPLLSADIFAVRFEG